MELRQEINEILAKAAKDIFATAPTNAVETLTAMRNAGAEHLVKEMVDALMEMITEMSGEFIAACVDEAGMGDFVNVEVYGLTPDRKLSGGVNH